MIYFMNHLSYFIIFDFNIFQKNLNIINVNVNVNINFSLIFFIISFDQKYVIYQFLLVYTS
jgi:hypothetical protein